VRTAKLQSTSAQAPKPIATKPIGVLLADDHAIVRGGVATILNRQADIEVVAETDNGIDAVGLYLRLRPQVMLVDLKMPGMEGVEVVEKVCAAAPNAAIVILTTYDTDDDIERALRAGAKAYLLKDVSPADLVACVRAVHEGRRWISPSIASKLAEKMTQVQLTPREMAVLRLITAGKANKEIASEMCISEGTVKIHITHLFEKLRVQSRTEAIAAAVRRGLVRMD
jgi:two-component system NarL family response regulator